MYDILTKLLLVAFFPGLFSALTTVMIIIWLERKIAARVQMRVGPYYVMPKLGGALQLLADGLRFFFQEVIVPYQVDYWPYILAPILSLTLTFATLLFIPVGPDLAAVYTPYNLIAFAALVAAIPVLTIVMGWASNNKFSLLGASREVLINISYEPLLFAILLSMAVLYGTLDLSEAVEKQFLPGILLNPLAALVAFIIFLTMTDRVPFDLVFGEQEIVAGPYTEYSGIMFGLAMVKDYLLLYSLALVYAILFLGGWKPFTGPMGALTLYLKAFIVMLIAVFLRAIYPRMRLDEALRFMWFRLLPLALLSIVYSIALKTLITQLSGW